MKKLLIVVGCLLAAGSAMAAQTTYSATLVNETSLGNDTNYEVDPKALGSDSVSAVAAYSSATVSNVTFSMGRVSTGAFTIANTTGLTTSYATNNITVVSNTGLSGIVITFRGASITEGIDWFTGATSSYTAASLASAMNSRFTSITSTAPAGSSVIYSTATTAGKAANTWAMSSSDPSKVRVASTTLSGGRDNAIVSINGTQLRANTNFATTGTAAATATSLAAAINANATLAALVTAHASGSVVTSTSVAVGTVTRYALYSSTSAITTSGATMVMGADAATTKNSDTLTVTAHGLGSGYGLWFSTGSGVALSPLVVGTTYYTIPVTANTFKLATTKANALAGTAITFTSSSTLTSAPSYTLNAPVIAGTPALVWQVSNDGTYWVNFSSNTYGAVVPPVTMSSYLLGGAVMGWDFGRVPYDRMRLKVTAPTSGGIWLKVNVVGKKD